MPANVGRMTPPQHDDGPLMTSKKGKRFAIVLWVVFWVLVVWFRPSEGWLVALFLAFFLLTGIVHSHFWLEERHGGKEAYSRSILNYLQRRPPYEK
jgi:hypothetical protein